MIAVHFVMINDHLADFIIRVEMLFYFLLLILFGIFGLIIGNAILINLESPYSFDRIADRAIISVWIGVLFLATPLSPPVTISATLLLPLVCLPAQVGYLAPRYLATMLGTGNWKGGRP